MGIGYMLLSLVQCVANILRLKFMNRRGHNHCLGMGSRR